MDDATVIQHPNTSQIPLKKNTLTFPPLPLLLLLLPRLHQIARHILLRHPIQRPRLPRLGVCAGPFDLVGLGAFAGDFDHFPVFFALGGELGHWWLGWDDGNGVDGGDWIGVMRRWLVGWVGSTRDESNTAQGLCIRSPDRAANSRSTVCPTDNKKQEHKQTSKQELNTEETGANSRSARDTDTRESTRV